MSGKRLAVRMRLAVVLAGGAIASVTLPGTAQEISPLVPVPQEDVRETKSVEQPPISYVRDIQQSATTVKEWRAQIEAATVPVTGIKLERTETRLNIILETAEGKSLLIDATKFRIEGNSLIADIPNAVLALPEGQAFLAENPTADIATVRVVQEGSTIRVSVAGKDAPPKTEVTLKTGNLAYSLNPAGEDEEIEIVVTGEEQRGYRVPNASTATRTDTPIRDIPQSIQVVPQQVLEDRKVRTLAESVETVSGVVDGIAFESAISGSRIIRGFSQSATDGGNTFFRNGSRDLDIRGLSAIGTIEQVEVLKGPASVLFGAVEPGGIINTITKQPLSNPYYKLEFEAGNYSYYQPIIDLSSPLNSDKSVLYRFIAGYQGSRTEQPFVDRKLTTIAPTIALNLGDRTKLNLYYEYVNFISNPLQTSAIRFSNGSLTPRDFYAGYPNLNSYDFTNQRFGYNLTHQFSDTWQIRNNIAVALGTYKDERNYVSSLSDDRFAKIESFDYNYSKSNIFGQIDLLGKFKTGEIDHQLLIGFDFNRFYQTVLTFQNINLPDFDLRNPNYSVVSTDRIADSNYETTIQSYGIYLQDQIALGDQFKLLIGGRYDWVAYEEEFSDFGIFGDTIDSPVQNSGAFSPRIGLVYQPSKDISLYASYSQSFVQTTGFNRDGRTFQPTRGTQYEVGIKTDFLDGRLSTTLAAYQITKTNVTTTDPTNPAFSIQVGEQRSRGIELDIAGEITPGWRVIASYAHTKAEVTADNTIPVGNRIDGVPENQASLWTTYEIQQGNLKGLGFGLGLFYVGERQGDQNNTFQLGSYLRTDASLFYRKDGFRASINVRNLFDQDYIIGGGSSVRVDRGSPFTITGSLSWVF
jgi:iron complex outermembrane recepter protein